MLLNSLIAPTIYFEKWRGLAVAITMMGTGVGGVLFPYMGNEIAKVFSWQRAFQVQAVFCGSLFFSGLTFRPIKPKRIVETNEEPKAEAPQALPRKELQGPSHKTADRKQSTIYFKKSIYEPGTRGFQGAMSTIALQEMGAKAAAREARGKVLARKLHEEKPEDVFVISHEAKQDYFKEELAKVSK